jgi:hypothetical protein
MCGPAYLGNPRHGGVAAGPSPRHTEPRPAKKAFVAIGAAALIAAGVAPANGASRGVRETSLEYVGPAYGVSISTPVPSSTIAGFCDPGIPHPPSKGCVRFSIMKGERFVALSIEDVTTLPVLGVAVDSHGRVLKVFCGATDGRLQLPPDAAHIDVWAMAGNCPDVVTPSVPTTGTITASFSRRAR